MYLSQNLMISYQDQGYQLPLIYNQTNLPIARQLSMQPTNNGSSAMCDQGL